MREPTPNPTPDLAAQVAALTAQVAVLTEALKRSEAENKLLRQKVDFLTRKLFGRSAEAFNPGQLSLGLGAEPAAESPENPAPAPVPSTLPRPARPPRAERMPEDLPEERVVLEPAEVIADRAAYRCIGKEEHVELDVTPTRYFRRVTERRKFVRIGERDAAPVIVPAPRRLIENSIASPGLLAQIVIGKHVDHLPLYRQEQAFRRDRIHLSRKTLCDWMRHTGNWLQPIAEAVAAELRATGYLQVDETMIRYLDPGNGSTRQGYLWTYAAPGAGVFFDWQTSRAATCLRGRLRDFHGLAQCDGYASYPAYNDSRPEDRRLTLLACWAHARRKFFEAKEDSFFARWMVGQIASLYAVEARLRQTKAGPAQRAAVRGAESRLILARIGRALRRQSGHLPQGPTGKAIAYTLGLWKELQLFVEHGQTEIDNNRVENAIRPTAIGKKNFLFFGSAEAGKHSAVFYTLIGTCKILGVDLREYLTDVLTRLPTLTNQQVAELTPSRWRDAKILARRLAA